ncbi:MAG: stage II sporulation protein P [Clostridia bacterium]|nr:stage II sporulation protein P [Clostridia bacterium]
MRIKVLTLKDIFKYLAKISVIFGILAIFAKFFYGNKNVNVFLKYDSSRFLTAIKNEIIVLNNTEIDLSSMGKQYVSNALNKEFNIMKTATIANNATVENIPINEDEELDKNQNIEVVESKDDDSDVPTNLPTEILPSNIPDKTTYELFGVKLRNECDYDLEKEITDLNVEFNKNDIIIFHTHTCESYTQTEQSRYEETGNYRTTDLQYSVARVGDELEKYLTNYGYNVIHDKSYHDYPSYNGSYNRSLLTVKSLLEKYQNTDVVIDLHRDAIGDNTYAPKVQIGDDCCARIMFVIGTDGGGLSHPDWRNNLKFAMKIVQKGNELYPGLFKPVIVRNSRYNHHVANCACIIEVGATGNTLEECLNSMKYLSKIYNEI